MKLATEDDVLRIAPLDKGTYLIGIPKSGCWHWTKITASDLFQNGISGDYLESLIVDSVDAT